MKRFATVSFLTVFLLLSANALAQVQYYGVYATVNDRGRSFIKLTITFDGPETSFRFDVVGRVENFDATSIAGPVDCDLDISGTTSVDCSLSLTQEKRTVDISFETNDFVRTLDDKLFFDADFTLDKAINQTFTFVKLPEGMVLADKQPFPEGATNETDGRRMIIAWKMYDLQPNQQLRFQVLYEQVQQSPLFQLRIGYFVIFGVAAAVVASIVYLRYFRKSAKLVLSVLDDYERKVMDILIAAEGVVKQKKVVQDTNLSKAKVSRVVKSLVERGLIEVERIGRTNRLNLVKKKLKL